MSREVENEMILRSIRQMAWQRAKGELQAILVTYWGGADQYAKMDRAVREFCEHVDGHGLAE